MKEERLYTAEGGADRDLSGEDLNDLFSAAFSAARASAGKSGPVLILPPDSTRIHSRAGLLAASAFAGAGSRGAVIMPALGTHAAMSAAELSRMFPGVPNDAFRVHDWRNGIVELGRLEADWVEKTCEGAVRYDWPAQVNRLLADGGFSLIVSIGQVVPHEVTGMANHAKNILVGTGGKEAIDKSHYAGACYGMERVMGRTDTPVRALFDEGMRRFGGFLPPVFYVLTVMGRRADGALAVRGLFAGFGRECFERAASLARLVNVETLDEPVQKAVVYLDPGEYRSTWLGNKAIYRTRMAMADGGELVVMAPGLERFGEDGGIDDLIRAYGYFSAAGIKETAAKEKRLGENLGAAAHLIHGSSEGRFTVRYCPGPGLSRKDIEGVGYEWGCLDETLARYNPQTLRPGWNDVNGTGGGTERIFFVPNPALGLWAEKRRFGARE
ncbi:MAG: lactate racemase domain-containing protein [Treponema sp.]|nr:lactate racemase domain-containing protein [Treponema sp.]